MGTSCGIYVRISDDREDTRAGVGRQEHDCRTLAAHQDWTVTEVYRENDTSAFKRRKVRLPDGTTALRVIRPQFRRMLDDLVAGRIDALIGYDLDRVARDPRDLEDLIDACETTGRPARSVTGNLDLSHDGGVTMARVAVAVANQASRDASRRIRRVKEANAAQGRWNGGGIRAYGYTQDRTAVIPAEAAVIRDLVERTIAGHSLNSLLTDLRTRNIPTVTGRGWSQAALRRILTSGVAAGRLHHRGQDVGPAPWPAIITHADYQLVLAELDGRPKNDRALTHWLTGLAVCGRCGHNLRGNSGSYLCETRRGGCNRIWVKQHLIEDEVATLLLRRVKRLGIPTVTAPTPPPDDTQLVELAAMWGRKDISLAEYRAARAEVLALLKAEQAPPVRVPAWVTSDLAAQWPDLSPTQRRTVTGAFLEAVVVGPSLDRRWRPERLDPRWR